MLTGDLTDDEQSKTALIQAPPNETAPPVETEAEAVGPSKSDGNRFVEWNGSWDSLPSHSRTLIVKSSMWAAIAGFIPFLLVLWDFRFDPFRAATAQRFASNFYDTQGRAILHGRMSVPLYSLGIEGFVIDGRTYMYFPPFPALLRLPVLLITDRLDGRLTAPSMLLAWVLLAAATAVLIWNVRMLMRGSSPVGRFEALAYGVLMVSITGGSVIVSDASLPWVYHEVYVLATALTVATLASLLALIRWPTIRRAVLAGAFALGVILTRTTSGWAMCLTVIAIGAWLAVRHRRSRRIAAALIGGGVLALFIGAAINWAKFRHPYMFPLEHQVWTTRNSRRRLALRMNNGTITGPQYFLTSLVNYFRPDGIRFVPYVPFVTLPADPARPYGGAFLDQWYRTGSVTTFMPLLFASTLWGFVSAFRRRVPAGIRALRIPLLGALLVAGGVMFYGYVAHRYTSEFLPVLILGSTIGVVDIAGRLRTRSRRGKQVAVTGMAALALFGCFASMAVGVAAARTTFRGAGLEQYVEWQVRSARFTGQLDNLVSHSDTLPDDAPTDRLHILGDCDALYLASGDAYEPWIALQSREYHVHIKPNPDAFHLGVLRLINIDGLGQRSISVEGDGTGRIRLRMGEGLVFFPSEWIDAAPGQDIDVGVRLDTAMNRYLITFGGQEVGYVVASETDDNKQETIVAIPSFALSSELDQTIVGYTLTPELGPRLDLCDRLWDATDSRD